MNEIMDILENDDDNNCDIYIEPPNEGNVTDEDSGNDDAGTPLYPENLSGNQLLAPAELRYRNKSDIEDEVEEDMQPARKTKRTSKEAPVKPKWKKEDKLLSQAPFPEGDYSTYNQMSETELFELFFSDELLDYCKKQMTKYCMKNNWPDISVAIEELRVFLGILIVSGYHPVPRRRMFWSQSPEVHNEAICSAMRRDRFDEIMKCLHFNATDDLDKNDKYAKLRPLINHLQRKFMEHYVPERNISHDEAMVEYFGKHSCKQAIRNKPIRFGYKIWSQNTTEGYLIAFDPYQGKTHQGDEELESKYGKCSATVLNLLNMYSDEKRILPYHLFTDNLFTTLPLLQEIKTRGYDGTGTVRKNRIDKSCPILDANTVDKKERGYAECVTGTMGSENIKVTRWKDNAVVTVASTLHGVLPVGKVKRWSKQKTKHVEIEIPKSVKAYNNSMGGTDQMDQNINCYRIGIRGKKWWWSLFSWLVDVSIQNAWILAKKRGSGQDHLDFRQNVAMSYLSRFQTVPKKSGMKRISSRPGFNDARFDRIDHFPIASNRRRCNGDGCSSTIRMSCSKCDVGLCLQCFKSYHMQ